MLPCASHKMTKKEFDKNPERYLKNKHTLEVDDFKFRCSIGKNGKSKKKEEGYKKTPIGYFEIEN